MSQTKKTKVISRVGTYILFHKLLFGGTLALACVMTLLSVLAPSVIQQVLDNVFTKGIGDGTLLIKGIFLIAGIFFFERIIELLSDSHQQQARTTCDLSLATRSSRQTTPFTNQFL